LNLRLLKIDVLILSLQRYGRTKTPVAISTPVVQILASNTIPNKTKHNFWTGFVAQVIECLPSKHEALNSNPSTTKTKQSVSEKV
jgi:hypothetical protein